MTDSTDPVRKLMGLYKSHPWHGVPIGDKAPDVVTCFIEIVPTDTVKYEIDKTSGYLKVDRPQKFSNICPTLYGLVPQTFCGEKVAEFCEQATGRTSIVGDGDPLDICVLSEKVIPRGDILLSAIPIGGLRMLDRNEADDKIIAVMQGDAVYGALKDVGEFNKLLLDRLLHYFLTYKQSPGEEKRACEITHVYNREEACEVIRRSRQDYQSRFGELERLLAELRSSRV